MQELGNLGSRLFQAAQESDSSVAALITTQKQTIEQEGTPKLYAIPGKKATPQRLNRKKRELKNKTVGLQKTHLFEIC